MGLEEESYSAKKYPVLRVLAPYWLQSNISFLNAEEIERTIRFPIFVCLNPTLQSPPNRIDKPAQLLRNHQWKSHEIIRVCPPTCRTRSPGRPWGTAR